MTIKKEVRNRGRKHSAEMKEGGRLRSGREAEGCWLRSAVREVEVERER